MSYIKRHRNHRATIVYHHCMAHTIYRTLDEDHYALEDHDKNSIVTLLRRLEKLYNGGVGLLQYTIMNNHIHLIISEKQNFQITNTEVKKRYMEFHFNNKPMDARSKFCTRFGKRLNNISEFMKDLLWYSATFFNNNRKLNDKRRRGSLWNPRFRSCLLESRNALLKCSLYVALNPVRAKMITHAEDYKWGSCGEQKLIGKHPHEAELRHFYAHTEFGDDCFDEIDQLFQQSLREIECAAQEKAKSAYSGSEVMFLSQNRSWNTSVIPQNGNSLLLYLQNIGVDKKQKGG
ncbi:MAG: hypothetical protein HRT88_07685 [Lentisphaeraceae bacterium]|nr:hypothetical protein [Lentisphaeraceae bacterium]